MDAIIVCSFNKYIDFLLFTEVAFPSFLKNVSYFVDKTYLIVPFKQLKIAQLIVNMYYNSSIVVLNEQVICPRIQEIKPYYRQMYLKLAYAQYPNASATYLIVDCDVLFLRSLTKEDIFFQDKLVYCHIFEEHKWHKAWQKNANKLLNYTKQYNEDMIMGMTPQIFKKDHVLQLIHYIQTKYNKTFFDVLKEQAYENFYSLTDYHQWTEYTLYWSYILYSNLVGEYVPGRTTTFWDIDSKLSIKEAFENCSTLAFVPQSNSIANQNDIYALKKDDLQIPNHVPNSLRIALIYTGDLRTFDSKQVQYLKQRYNLDVFGFGWQNYIDSNNLFERYEWEDKDHIKKSVQIKPPPKEQYFRVEGCAPIINIINQLYSWKRGFDLMSKHEIHTSTLYDVVIRTRFDYFLQDFCIQELLYSQFNSNIIFIPHRNANHGHELLCDVCIKNEKKNEKVQHVHTQEICDMFCIGSRSVVEHYCNLHDYVHQVYLNQWGAKHNWDYVYGRWPHLKRDKNQEWIVDPGIISEQVACFHPEALLMEHLKSFALLPSHVNGKLIK